MESNGTLHLYLIGVSVNLTAEIGIAQNILIPNHRKQGYNCVRKS